MLCYTLVKLFNFLLYFFRLLPYMVNKDVYISGCEHFGRIYSSESAKSRQSTITSQPSEMGRRSWSDPVAGGL